MFFSAMGWKWEYEPEGFQFSNGSRYLPDFRVQFSKVNAWVEIKPYGEPTTQEKEKARNLSRESGSLVLLVCGQPSIKNDSYRIVVADDDSCLEIEFENAHVFAPCRKCDACQIYFPSWGDGGYWTEHTGSMLETCETDQCTDKIGAGDWSRIESALALASAERFGT